MFKRVVTLTAALIMGISAISIPSEAKAYDAKDYSNAIAAVSTTYVQKGVFSTSPVIRFGKKNYRADASGYVGAILNTVGVFSKGAACPSACYMQKNGAVQKALAKAGYARKSAASFDMGSLKVGDILVRKGCIHICSSAPKKGRVGISSWGPAKKVCEKKYAVKSVKNITKCTIVYHIA